MALSVKRLIVAAGTMAGVIALGMPVAAHASTHSARPTILSVRPAAGVPDVAPNGNGALWSVTLSNGVVCSWEIGDHAMSNYTAAGEADIKCPHAYTVTEKVNLDYASAKGGTYSTAVTSGWKSGSLAAGTYLDLPTAGWCWPGPGVEPALYWTTYAWISIGGSNTVEGWSKQYVQWEPAYC